MRDITGYRMMAHQYFLHQESKVMPFKAPNALLAEQCHLSCHRMNHPNKQTP